MQALSLDKPTNAQNTVTLPNHHALPQDSHTYPAIELAETSTLIVNSEIAETFTALLAGRQIKVRNDIWQWKVMQDVEALWETMLEQIVVAYGRDSDKKYQKRIQRLEASDQIVGLFDSEDELQAFLPLLRFPYGWKASFFGYRNKLAGGLSIGDFCAFLKENIHRVHFSMQISKGLARIFVGKADLPIVPTSVVQKIKKDRVRIPSQSELEVVIQNQEIPDTEAARQSAYWVDVPLSEGQELECKLMVGSTMLETATHYRDKKLGDFIDHPLWKHWCAQFQAMPRAGYGELGYNGQDVVDLLTHTERVAKAAQILGEREGANADLLHVMASLHDFIEVFTGDIVSGRVKADKKSQMEHHAWQREVTSRLDEAWVLYSFWEAYETQTCLEAQLIWQVDKMEPLIEAVEFLNTHPQYESRRQIIIPMIMTSVEQKISHPCLVSILNKLRDLNTQNQLTFEVYCQWLQADSCPS